MSFIRHDWVRKQGLLTVKVIRMIADEKFLGFTTQSGDYVPKRPPSPSR